MNNKNPLVFIVSFILIALTFYFGRALVVRNNLDDPEPSFEGKNPVVTIEMDSGEIIKIELYPNYAPNTVENFIYLINKDFYDGLTFHRVVQDFIIQGGDPKGDGTGGPGYRIKGEFKSNGFLNELSHTRGVISMARSMDFDSAGSQFFIVQQDSTYLDGQYAAFGKVIEGMELVDSIASLETDEREKPYEEQVMIEVSVDTYDVNFSEPEREER